MTNLLKFQDDLDDVTVDADLKKKRHVIMLTKRFPAYHVNAGEETNFARLAVDGIKRHTLRNTGQRIIKQCDQVNAGEAYFSIRHWAGRPYHSTQIEIARMYEGRFETLGIQKVGFRYYVSVDDQQITCPIASLKYYQALAQNDGMTADQLDSWLFDNQKTTLFGGILLHFTK